MRYFAYGTNCNPEVLDRKGVAVTSRERATLPDHRLRFNKRALRPRLPEGVGFANVEPATGESVEGLLYELAEADVETLDAAERCPEHYERVAVEVVTSDGPREAFTYRARPEVTADGLRPSRNYLDHIARAQDFLSHAYYEALGRRLTYEGACEACARTGEVVFVREAEIIVMLCQPCREARATWSTAHGRRLTVAETAAVMALVRERGGFASIGELVREAVEAGAIEA